jgi:hypothetical protein
MSKLTPEAQAILDAARAAHEPSRADRSRVRAALWSTIGGMPPIPPASAAPGSSGAAGAGGSGASAAAPSAAAGAAAATAATGAGVTTATIGAAGTAGAAGASVAMVALKALVSAAVISGAAAAASVGVYEVAAPEPPATATVVALAPATALAMPRPDPIEDHADRAPPAAVAATAPSLPPAGLDVAARLAAPAPSRGGGGSLDAAPPSRLDDLGRHAGEAAPAPAPPPAPTDALAARPRLRSAAPPLAPPAPAVTTLREETSLLHSAQAALRTDPARALELLDEHARRFPSGVLREERSAARVLALCALGRAAEARAEAARFVATWPRSLHADRVRASCALAASPPTAPPGGPPR